VIVTGVLAPGLGRMLAGLEPKPIMRAVLRGASSTRPHSRRTTSTNCSRSAVDPATRPLPAPSTRACPAWSRPDPATPRSQHPSTSSTAKRTGHDRRIDRPTNRYSRTPNSLTCPTPGTSWPSRDPTCSPTCSPRWCDPAGRPAAM